MVSSVLTLFNSLQGPGGEYIEYVPDDFSGFRVIALVPRMRPQWPAPGMQEVSNMHSRQAFRLAKVALLGIKCGGYGQHPAWHTRP